MTQTEPAVLMNYSLDPHIPTLPWALISPQSNLNSSDAHFISVLYVHQQTCPRLVIIAALLHNSPKVEITRTFISREGLLEAHSQ